MSGEIDPHLPYIQVHRSVAHMAAQLAPLLEVSYQHARGGLDVLWETLADRRILAKALALPKPMVLLGDPECRRRLRLAFGRPVEPDTLETVGALERQPDGQWRVRGMSRYIDAELARHAAQAERSKGGKSRAQSAQRDAHGRLVTAPPPAPAAGAPAGEQLAVSWSAAGRQLVTPPAGDLLKPSSEVRGERREARGETEKARGNGGPPPSKPTKEWGPVVVTPPDTPPEHWLGEDIWRWAQCRRQAAGFVAETNRPAGLGGWWTAVRLTPGVTVARVKEAFYAFGESEHWRAKNYPFAGFMAQWAQFMPPEVPRAAQR